MRCGSSIASAELTEYSMAQLVYCLLLLGSLLVGSEIVFGQTSDRIEDAKREGQVVFFSGMIVQDTDRRLSSIPWWARNISARLGSSCSLTRRADSSNSASTCTNARRTRSISASTWCGSMRCVSAMQSNMLPATQTVPLAGSGKIRFPLDSVPCAMIELNCSRWLLVRIHD
jgi:hypothetical protein